MGSAPAGPLPGTEVQVDSVVFEPKGTLTLNPMQRAALNVRVEPRGVYLVQFSVVSDSAGSANEASLDHSEVLTDADGGAGVLLTAPSKATTFRIRAKVGLTQTELGVSVSGSGFSKLSVTPLYQGKRSIGEWTASVTSRLTCADQAKDPLLDGDLVARRAKDATPLVLEDVPASTPLVVLLRGDATATGCLEILPLMPGQAEPVTVTAADLPLRMDQASLATSFAVSTTSQSFYDTVANDITTALAALESSHGHDVGTLLDAMEELAAADLASFAEARQAGQWDEAIAQVWGADAKVRLRSQASQWMTDGIKSLQDQALLTGELQGSAELRGQASFVLSSVAGVDPRRAGFMSSTAATWDRDPGDTVLFAMNVLFKPSELVTALGEREAKRATQSQTFSEALSVALGCAQVAEALARSGPTYASCGAPCFTQLCGNAASLVWSRARGASGALSRGLQVSASAQAAVDANAAVAALDGNWVGRFDLPDEVAMTGTLSAASTAKAP